MKRFFVESDLDFVEVTQEVFNNPSLWEPNWVNNVCWVHEEGWTLHWTAKFANVETKILHAFRKLQERVQLDWSKPGFPAVFLSPNEALKTDPWTTVHEEMPLWMNHNFPDWKTYASTHLVFGAVEELGEVTSAWFEDDFPEMRKETGDVLVYLVSLCVSNGWDIRDFLLEGEEYPEGEDHPLNDGSSAVPYRYLLDVVRSLGVICRATLKMKQGIRGNEDHTKNLQKAIGITVQRLEAWLTCWEVHQESNCAEILADRWATVRQRDWQKDANKGGTDALPD